jgi:hypothetical protein
MTEEEVEIVAEELAKIGGPSWYPGRTRGPLLRTVSERYRERARVAIAAIERLRALRENDAPPEGAVLESPPSGSPAPEPRGRFQVGDTVVYRPPGDQRAVPCRVEKLEERRAYLVPCARPDFGWVSLDDLSLMASKDNDNMHG